MVVKYKFKNIVYFHVVWKILHVPVVGRFSYLYGAYTRSRIELTYGCNIVILYVKHLPVQEPEDGHYKLAETCSLK
jgi:hypothetical protein